MILTRRPNAFLKSNLTQPLPKFHGSWVGRPFLTGPGKPIDTASYFQSPVTSRIARTMPRGVRRGPDGTLSGIRCPATRPLTFVPPPPPTRTFTPAPLPSGDPYPHPALPSARPRPLPLHREARHFA